jgi:fucose 4-O-acetylase-like acetyltransferase
MERKIYIDILRGIAIIFVVFAHVTRIYSCRAYFFSFHMPLFFFISGIVFSSEKYRNFSLFFRKKINSLIVPHCLFYLLTFLYWLFIEREYRGSDISPASQLIGLVYGTDNTTYMFFNGALWFLPCLFTVEMLYFLISKIGNKWIITGILISSYITGMILLSKNITGFPWGGNIALFACYFYGLGHLVKNKIVQIEKKWSLKHYFLIIIFCSILQFLTINHAKLDMADLQISVLSMLIPFAGIILYLSVALILKKNRILEFLGKNSLIIFAFQGPVYRAIIVVCATIVKQEVDFIRKDLFFCILITIISILLIIPLIILYNRFIIPQIRKF